MLDMVHLLSDPKQAGVRHTNWPCMAAKRINHRKHATRTACATDTCLETHLPAMAVYDNRPLNNACMLCLPVDNFRHSFDAAQSGIEKCPHIISNRSA